MKDLCETLMRPKKKAEMMMLLGDLFTPSELESLVERVQLIKRLLKGMPQRDISSELKISIAKITRGSLALKKSRGGFRQFIK